MTMGTFEKINKEKKEIISKKVPSGVANCRNVPFCGRARARLTGVLSKGGKMRGVATNVYLWKTSKKSKETGQNENSKFGSCIYV